ncbi:MAG: glycosyltransferase family 4 protein [Candidatus Bathyarchaeia archaeon]
MRVLAIAHRLWRGGAQESTLEMLGLLKRRDMDIRVLTCDSSENAFLSDLENLGIVTFTAPAKIVANYPDLAIERHAELIKSSDLVWITDVEYLVAPKIKKIKADMPVIASLHSFALMCPIWDALFGMQETCTENCSHSLQRFAQCKLLAKQYLAHWHQRSTRMKAYQLLNLPKSYLDFVTWPMNEVVVESIDGFLAVSQFTKDLVRTHLPGLNAPIEVIPNPVTMPEPNIAAEDYHNGDHKLILYPSGSGISKGPHIALYAIRKLLDEGSKDLTLTMLKTQGDLWIRNLVKRLRLENQVRLLPTLPRTQVSTLMANSSVVLVPSLAPETFGRIPVEANLLGTPAVVSNRGALPNQIVDRATGIVTEPTVDAFAKSVDEALRVDWDRELIARTAKERFNPERICDDLVRFLETFI